MKIISLILLLAAALSIRGGSLGDLSYLIWKPTGLRTGGSVSHGSVGLGICPRERGGAFPGSGGEAFGDKSGQS